MILTFLGACTCYYVSVNYVIVPDIKLGETQARSAFEQLSDAGLFFNKSSDKLATIHEKIGIDISNDNYKVSECDPAPGTVVRKNSEIKLTITWIQKDSFFLPASIEDFNPKTFYEKDGHKNLNFNTGRDIGAFVVPVSLKTVVEGVENIFYPEYPAYQTDKLVEGQLINYDTGEIVAITSTYLGDEILFSDVQDGTYYYVISCEGYKSAVSECLILINSKIVSLDYHSTYSIVGLEQFDENYSIPFRIQILDSQGNELRNASVNVRIVNKDNFNDRVQYTHPLVTDEFGYLTQKTEDYQTKGNFIEFCLCEGYILEVTIDNEEYVVAPYRKMPVDPFGENVVRVQLSH